MAMDTASLANPYTKALERILLPWVYRKRVSIVVIAFPGYCEMLRFSSRFNNKAQRSRNPRVGSVGCIRPLHNLCIGGQRLLYSLDTLRESHSSSSAWAILIMSY